MSTIVLGINESHDSSAAIFEDGICIGAIATERVTRKKHHSHVVKPAVEYLFDKLLISPNQIALLVNCIHRSNQCLEQREEFVFRKDILKSVRTAITINSHHYLHAFSVLIGSNVNEALILVSDGIGSDFIHLPEQCSKFLQEVKSEMMYESFTIYKARDYRLSTIMSIPTT